jgi:hypothetical protein
MYVYIETSPFIWTVGFFDPNGIFIPESDQTDPKLAAKRVAWLNGKKIRNFKKEFKSNQIPVYSHEKLTVKELIETIETKLWTQNDSKINVRLINILKNLSLRIIYADEITKELFFSTRNAGKKSWFILQELLTITTSLHEEFNKNTLVK